jgi:hypothetical protein
MDAALAGRVWLGDWFISEMADKSSSGDRLKAITSIEGDDALVSRIHLDVQGRPAAFHGSGNDGGKQSRPDASAAPGRQNIKLLQPAAPSTMLKAENASCVSNAYGRVVRQGSEKETVLGLSAQSLKNSAESI